MMMYGRANHGSKFLAPIRYNKELYCSNPNEIPVYRKFFHDLPKDELLFNKQGRMFACKTCKKGPYNEFDVGDPITGSYEIPQALKDIDNYNDRKYISLCNLDCMFIPAENVYQIQKAQGISDIIAKSYNELTGLLSTIITPACDDERFARIRSATIDVRVRSALRWLCCNNFMYRRLVITPEEFLKSTNTGKQAGLPRLIDDGTSLG
jgi:hypothetical protein